jgi:hypothetical protein
MVGHAQSHRPVGLAEIPRKRGLCTQDNGQPTRPEFLGQGARIVGNLRGQSIQCTQVADQHGGRHLPTAALGRKKRTHGVRVECIRTDPIDRIGGEHDHAAAAKRVDGLIDSRTPHRLAVRWHNRIAHLTVPST